MAPRTSRPGKRDRGQGSTPAPFTASASSLDPQAPQPQLATLGPQAPQPQLATPAPPTLDPQTPLDPQAPQPQLATPAPPTLDPQAPQPQKLAPPAHQTSQALEPSFYVYYSEASEAHKFSYAPETLAKDAVRHAVASARYSLSQSLNVKEEDLLSKPSFPTSFGVRQFTMQEWTEIGRGPHVDIIMVDPTSSLRRRKDAALHERDEAIAAKEKAQKVAHEVTFQSLMVSDEPKAVQGECGACPKLRESVKLLGLQIDQQRLQVEQQRLQIEQQRLQSEQQRVQFEQLEFESSRVAEKLRMDVAVQQQIASHLLDHVSELRKDRDRSRKVLLRVILSEAREKALSHLGTARPTTTSWASFFADHEHQLMHMSAELLELLKNGGHVLNKAAHLASRKKQAKAVLELPQGNQRLAFLQAFLYAYGENAEDYFEQ